MTQFFEHTVKPEDVDGEYVFETPWFNASLPPIARDTDGETSHEAAAKVKRVSQIEQVLKAIKAHPGLTAGEIGDVTSINGVWKRISDLKNQGRIRAGVATAYYKGNRQQTWWPILRGEH